MKDLNIWLYIISILLLSSCQSIYIPGMQNVPLLKNEGDLNITVNGNNFQMAYANHPHSAIIAEAYFKNNSFNSFTRNLDFRDYNLSNFSLEAGKGNFKSIGNMQFELYTGGGIGHTRFEDNTNSMDIGTFNSSFLKLFIQPDIGYISNNFEIIFSGKLVAINYINPFNYYNDNSNGTNILFSPSTHFPFLFMEPCITFRTGFKNVKFQIQAIQSHKISKRPLSNRNFQINAGINLRLNGN